MKKTAVTLMIAGILIVVGIVLIGVGGLSADNGNRTFSKEEAMSSVSIEIAEDFDELEVECTSDDILIKVSEDGKCRVESWESDGQKLIAEVLGDRLYIEREKREEWKLFFWDRVDYSGRKTVVYLPQDTYSKATLRTTSGEICISESIALEEVSLHSTSGNIEVFGVTAGDVNVSSTSGEILMSNVSAGKVQASVTSGDLLLEDVSVDASVKMETTSGDINLDGVRSEKIEMHTASGECLLEDVSAEGSVMMEATSGDIEFDRLKSEKIEIYTTSGDIEGSIVGPMSYDPKTTSGDIRVPNIADGGECWIKTTSGDIRITEINE